MKTHLIKEVDDPRLRDLYAFIDPLSYGSALERIPKLAILASDDEFMMMDWPNIWYDEYRKYGESHLYIAPNAEHSLATGLFGVLSTATTFARSIAIKATDRPDFEYKYDPSNGEITIIPKGGYKVHSVLMHHGETFSSERRDFRWIRQANNRTAPCDWPYIPLPDDVANCVTPIFWHATKAEEVDGVYKIAPPEPKKEGHWVGYYVSVSFQGDTEHLSILKNKFTFSTPGYTWPNTLPFPDCDSREGTCIEQLV